MPIIATEIPIPLLRRLEAHIASQRDAMLATGNKEVILPTRSAFIRAAIKAHLERAENSNGNKKT